MAIKSKDKPRTDLQETYWRFWGMFNLYTKDNTTFCREFKVHPYPSVRSYQDYHIGEPFHIVAGINFRDKEICVGAYFGNLDCYEFWYKHGNRWLESYMGKRLVWNKFKTKGSIYVHTTANFDNEHGWDNAYKVIVETMIKLKNAFKEDVKL